MMFLEERNVVDMLIKKMKNLLSPYLVVSM